MSKTNAAKRAAPVDFSIYSINSVTARPNADGMTMAAPRRLRRRERDKE